MEIQGKYKKINTALKAAKKALKAYYSVVNFKKNKHRYKLACRKAEVDIIQCGVFRMKGAQWGGKWGNYYRCVALNNKGEYVFVEGFNIEKELLNS